MPPFGPAELGIRQSERRPYGSVGLAEEDRRRVRASQATGNPLARPPDEPSRPGELPSAVPPPPLARNRGAMTGPPEPEEPEPGRAAASEAEPPISEGAPPPPGPLGDLVRSAIDPNLWPERLGAVAGFAGEVFALQPVFDTFGVPREWNPLARLYEFLGTWGVDPIVGVVEKGLGPEALQRRYEELRGEAPFWDVRATALAAGTIKRELGEAARIIREDPGSPTAQRLAALVLGGAEIAGGALPIPAGAALARAAGGGAPARAAAPARPTGAVAPAAVALPEPRFVAQPPEAIARPGAARARSVFEPSAEIPSAAVLADRWPSATDPVGPLAARIATGDAKPGDLVRVARGPYAWSLGVLEALDPEAGTALVRVGGADQPIRFGVDGVASVRSPRLLPEQPPGERPGRAAQETAEARARQVGARAEGAPPAAVEAAAARVAEAGRKRPAPATLPVVGARGRVLREQADELRRLADSLDPSVPRLRAVAGELRERADAIDPRPAARAAAAGEAARPGAPELPAAARELEPTPAPRPEEAPLVGARGRARGDVEATAPNLGINLDLIRAPDRVKAAIAEEAVAQQDLIQQWRRGVVSLEALHREARERGLDVPELAKIQPGTPFSPEMFLVARAAVVRRAQERVRLEGEIRRATEEGTATPEMKARLFVVSLEQSLLQRVLAGGRAEWGRAGRAMQMLDDGSAAANVKGFWERALEAAGGEPNVDRLVRALNDIATDTHLTQLEREAAAYRLVARLHEPTFWEFFEHNFYNAILSHPITHEANVIAQTGLLYADLASEFGAAGFEAAVTAGGRVRPREVTFSGAFAASLAMHRAIPTAIREMAVYARTGVSRYRLMKFQAAGGRPEISPFAAGGLGRVVPERVLGVPQRGAAAARRVVGAAGEVLDIPTRALGAEDVFFSALAYHRRINLDAANAVAARKINPLTQRARFGEEVAKLVQRPTREMVEAAMRDAAEASLRQHGPAMAQAMAALRSIPLLGARPLVFVMPFVRIGFNLTTRGAEYSPLGIVRAITARTPLERGRAFARAGIGTAILSYFLMKAAEGKVTGRAPVDPTERADWLRRRRQQYAIGIDRGDPDVELGAARALGGGELGEGERYWIRYDRFEPLTAPMRWSAAILDVLREDAGKPLDVELVKTTAVKAAMAVGLSIADATYFTGIGRIVDAFESPAASGLIKLERILGETARAQVPFSSALRGAAQVIDPVLRDPEGIVEQIEAGLPWSSTNVPPQVDVTGDEVLRPESRQGIGALVNPFIVTRERPDPVADELARLRLPPRTVIEEDGTVRDVPQRELLVALVREEVAEFNLTRDEGLMLRRVAGKAVWKALAELFEDRRVGPDGEPIRYSGLDEDAKARAALLAINQGRRVARAAVADAILEAAKTPDQTRRAAAMRLSIISRLADRAEFLGGLQRRGKLTSSVREFLDERQRRRLGPDEPTVAEHLRAGPLVAQYRALDPFRFGDPAEWREVERLRRERSRVERDQGEVEARLFTRENPLLRRYDTPTARNPEREKLLRENPWLERWARSAD